MIDCDLESTEQVEAAIKIAIDYQVQKLDLSFSYSYKFSIPDSIGDIVSLKELTIYSRYGNAHGLQEISSSIGKLSNLISLSISNAYYGLENLPESIGKLSTLKSHIYLYGNPLNYLPDSILQLPVEVIYY